MPRITTSNTDKKTVKALERLARYNRRTPAKEALVAVEKHILTSSVMPVSTKSKQP